MKKLVFFMALFGVSNWAAAQITVTAATFPESGDTLKTALDLNPSGIAITPPGVNFEWDFSGLQATTVQETVYRPASEGTVGADLPEAELFVDNGGAETYYNVTASAFELLALNGGDPASGIPFQTVFKFTTPIPERRSPMTFPSNNGISSSLNVPFALTAIPADILDSLGIPGGVDSLRIRVTAQRNDFVDAFGNLTIPGGTYAVLREKRTEYRETRLDIKVPIIGWTDITDIIIGGAGGGMAANFGLDTIVTYNFFNDTEKEIIAVVTMNASQDAATQVRFKNNGLTDTKDEFLQEKPYAMLSPNPVSNEAHFQLKNWQPGNYEIRIVDVRGMSLLSQRFQASDEHFEQMEVGALPAGQFFFQILDESGRNVAAGKFLKN